MNKLLCHSNQCKSFIFIFTLFSCNAHLLKAQNFNEVKKLIASNAQSDDLFGYSSSVSGNIAIIGASEVGTNSGSAYIFYKDQGGANNWGEVKKLIASDAVTGDRFGISVFVSGEIAIVGASFNDDNGNNSGSAYIYAKDQGGIDNWGEVKKLTASDAATNHSFGISVSLSQDNAIVGAQLWNSSGQSDGSVYIFSKNQGGTNNWGEVKKLIASDGTATDFFGSSVSISNNIALVGAVKGGNGNGSAYVFVKDQGGINNWGEVSILTASDAAFNDKFGWSVHINGNTAIIGAYDNDDNGESSGSAYVFSKDQGGTDNWGQSKKLIGSDVSFQDEFGWSVSTNGDVAIVGSVEAGLGNGSAYIFGKNQGGPGNWGELSKLTASDGAFNDLFGRSVSISSNIAVVGALADNSDKGAAYIFSLSTIAGCEPSTVNPEIHVEAGDIYLEEICRGIILTNPNGDCFRIVVDVNGALQSEQVTCP